MCPEPGNGQPIFRSPGRLNSILNVIPLTATLHITHIHVQLYILNHFVTPVQLQQMRPCTVFNYRKSDTFHSPDYTNAPCIQHVATHMKSSCYSQLASMPRKKIQRNQFWIGTMCVSIESIRVRFDRILPIPMDHICVLPDDPIIGDDPIMTQVHHEAPGFDNEQKEEHKDDSTFPEVEHTRGGHDILTEITEDDQIVMFERNKMLLKLLSEQPAQWTGENTTDCQPHKQTIQHQARVSRNPYQNIQAGRPLTILSQSACSGSVSYPIIVKLPIPYAPIRKR